MASRSWRASGKPIVRLVPKHSATMGSSTGHRVSRKGLRRRRSPSRRLTPQNRHPVTGSSRVAWVSITRNLEQVTDLIFRQTPRYETPALVSALVLIGLVVVSISVLERRVRGVEVVK